MKLKKKKSNVIPTTMSFENCEISFSDRQIPVFYAGEQINGTVKMVLGKTRKIHDLRIIVSGLGKCSFTQRIPTTYHANSQNKKSFHGEEVFLNKDDSLLKEVEKKDGKYVLEDGEHLFPFSFLTDNYLPTSYRGSNGKIRYKITLKLEKTSSSHKIFCFYITLISYVDLNYTPSLNLPVRKEIAESMTFFFLNQGSLKIAFEIPKTGFIPGERIPVKCEIENESGVQINAIYFSLIKVQNLEHDIVSKSIAEHTATSPYLFVMDKEEKVAVNIIKNIDKEKNISKEVRIGIPPLPPSTLYNSRCVINIQYKIKIKVDVAGMHYNISEEIPIVIGTVALKPSECPQTILPPILPLNPPPSPAEYPKFESMKEKDEKACIKINSKDDSDEKIKVYKYKATYPMNKINEEE